MPNCSTCDGSGFILCEDGPTESGDVRQRKERCPDCNPPQEEADMTGATEGDR